MTSCIVVGAGVSALTAARELSAAGRRVVVLDEGHRAGVRMATRGIGSGIFDLGAQFFTTRSERFEKRAFRETRRGWLEAGLVEEWTRGFAEAERATMTATSATGLGGHDLHP